MRYSAVALLFALVPLSAADDKKPDEPVKAGDVLRVGPGAIPMPGVGIPLAETAEQAERVTKVFKAEKFEGLLKLSDELQVPYLRASMRVKATGPADKNGIVPVEVVAGTSKGKTGFMPAVVLAREMPPPNKPVKLAEDTRRKVFDRYFVILTESFQQAVKESKPDAKRAEVEFAAVKILARKMDAEAKTLGIGRDDWLPIVQQGFADKWPAAWREK